MFDPCSRWRRLLALRSDNLLASNELGRLNDHLERCVSCREIAEADDALHVVVGYWHTENPMSEEQAENFDDAVLATLTQGAGALPVPVRSGFGVAALWKRLTAPIHHLSLSSFTRIFAQIGGGAVLAASITAIFLMPALHYGTASRAAQSSATHAVSGEEMNTVPVSMDALLNDPSPITARLWSAPMQGNRRKNGVDKMGTKSRSATGTGVLWNEKPNQTEGGGSALETIQPDVIHEMDSPEGMNRHDGERTKRGNNRLNNEGIRSAFLSEHTMV